MSHETRGQRCASATGRSRSTHDGELLDLLPAEALSVVEATCVDKLTEELDGGLCTILFSLWHVNIIDKDDTLRVALNTPNLLSFPHQLAFNVCLSAFTLSLR